MPLMGSSKRFQPITVTIIYIIYRHKKNKLPFFHELYQFLKRNLVHFIHLDDIEYMIGADTNNYVQQPIHQSTSSNCISCYELCAKSIRREHKSWRSTGNQALSSSNKRK